MWSSCWCSSWLYNTGVAGSWTGGTGCFPPRVPAAGPGSGRGAAACRRWSWCMVSGKAVGMGSGWKEGCADVGGSHEEAECPWIPACIRLPRAGGAARNGRKAEHCWSDVWSCSSWSTHQAPSLFHKKRQNVQYVNRATRNN